jgi:hypothetical protein
MVPLVEGLYEASRLKYLTFHPDCSIVEPVIKVATIPSLKRIRVITRYTGQGVKPSFEKLRDAGGYVSHFESLMREDRRLYDKVVYERYAFAISAFLSLINSHAVLGKAMPSSSISISWLRI